MYKLVNGETVLMTDAEVADSMAQQARAQEDARKQKAQEINAAYAAADMGTFTYAGKVFQADARSQAKIFGVSSAIAATGAMPAGWAGGWQALDNTVVPIPDVPAWGAFVAAMVAQGTANFMHAQALKAALAAATTPEQVSAINW